MEVEYIMGNVEGLQLNIKQSHLGKMLSIYILVSRSE